MYTCIIGVHVCMYIYACVYMCMYYICMYVYMYLCVYVCMDVCIYLYSAFWESLKDAWLCVKEPFVVACVSWDSGCSIKSVPIGLSVVYCHAWVVKRSREYFQDTLKAELYLRMPSGHRMTSGGFVSLNSIREPVGSKSSIKVNVHVFYSERMAAPRPCSFFN